MSYCTGCRPRDKKCAFLKKRCELLLKGNVKYCYECNDFPCERLERLDKRYRTYFKVRMIENLEYIKKNGINRFLEKEEETWKCLKCGAIICCSTVLQDLRSISLPHPSPEGYFNTLFEIQGPSK